MPATCNEPDCNAAVTLTGSNGETNPERDRLETYECEFGHRFTITLQGSGGY